jgi:hypothetical protein
MAALLLDRILHQTFVIIKILCFYRFNSMIYRLLYIWMLQMYLPLSVYMHYYTHDTRHFWGRHGRDRMVVGFTTTCAISAYHLNFWIRLWCLRHFQQYFIYIVGVIFIGEENRSTRRKPPTYRKLLTNFITYCCIEYTSPLTELIIWMRIILYGLLK